MLRRSAGLLATLRLAARRGDPFAAGGTAGTGSGSLTSSLHATTAVRYSSVPAGTRRDTGASLPIKDRYPPAAYDPADPRRRLIVLVDGDLVSKRSFDAAFPRITPHGVPLLTRVFARTLKGDWSPEVLARRVEWFRVEQFIPVHMQIAADAGHVARFRKDNQIQGICFVVADAETAQYEAYFARPELQGINLYCFGEDRGLTKAINADGRKGDGAARE